MRLVEVIQKTVYADTEGEEFATATEAAKSSAKHAMRKIFGDDLDYDAARDAADLVFNRRALFEGIFKMYDEEK